MKIRSTRIRRLALLSKLSVGTILTDSIFVGHGSALPLKQGDKRSISWKTFVLYPASNVPIAEILQKTDEFLTTETGFEFGAMIDFELEFDAPFDPAFEDEVGDSIIQTVAKILQDTLGLHPDVLREPSNRWKKWHHKQANSSLNDAD
jgi:hypothetical protein